MNQDAPLSVLCRPSTGRVFEQLCAPKRCVILAGLRGGWVDSVDDVLTRGSDEELLAFEHTHLPKLAHADYVEWNRETGALVRGSNFSEVEPFLEMFGAHADELPAGKD